MPTLPTKPKRGSTLKDANLPQVIGQIIDYCRAITPRPSSSVLVFTLNNGTTFKAIQKKTAAQSSQQGAGQWSGIVWFLGIVMWDFNRVDADPEGDLLSGGLAVDGTYLVVSLLDGSTRWALNPPADLSAAAFENYYPVGVEDSTKPSGYGLSVGRVVGDIRIDFKPYHAPLEEEEGASS